MRQDGEPSVEEILASIKKVIARDQREGAPLRQRPSAPEDAAGEPDEVLELGAEAELVEEADRPGADAPLIAEDVREAMRDTLAALAVIAQPGAKAQIVRSGETSLEGLVRDLLRPMLAEWLDRNLPGMVERMVAAEIARIAGKRG